MFPLGSILDATRTAEILLKGAAACLAFFFFFPPTPSFAAFDWFDGGEVRESKNQKRTPLRPPGHLTGITTDGSTSDATLRASGPCSAHVACYITLVFKNKNTDRGWQSLAHNGDRLTKTASPEVLATG